VKSQEKIKRRRHVFRLDLHGVPIEWPTPYSDGKHTVTIHRTRGDIKAGQPGIAVACADMKCAMRNKNAFPHPVYFAEFGEHFCYIVDRWSKRQNKPLHCLRYRHNDKTIPIFDIPASTKGGMSGKDLLLESDEAVLDIVCHPPYPSDVVDAERKHHRADEAKRLKDSKDGSRTKRHAVGPQGAMRRLVKHYGPQLQA
jgi:hypothetical protein